ncbi:MAG: hypothetical protein AAF985_11900, partial [Bacteroidota bacterium]
MNKYTNIENKIKVLIEEKSLDQKADELLALAEKSNVSVYALNLLIECGFNAENAMIINQDGIHKVKISLETSTSQNSTDEQVATKAIEPKGQVKETKSELKAPVEEVVPKSIEKAPAEKIELKFVDQEAASIQPNKLIEIIHKEAVTEEQEIPLVLGENSTESETKSEVKPEVKPEVKVEPFTNNQVWYALRPDGNRGFLIKELSTNIEDRYYYKIEQTGQDTANFTLVEDEGLQQNAILSDSFILRGACVYENEPEGSKSIVVSRKGSLRRIAEEWVIVQKASIKFIAPPPPVRKRKEPVFKLKQPTAEHMVEADFKGLKMAFTEKKTTKKKKIKQQRKQETGKKKVDNNEEQSKALLN